MLHRPRNDGFTLYQLLVSIIVLVVIGTLWGAYNKYQQTKQHHSYQMQSRNG